MFYILSVIYNRRLSWQMWFFVIKLIYTTINVRRSTKLRVMSWVMIPSQQFQKICKLWFTSYKFNARIESLQTVYEWERTCCHELWLQFENLFNWGNAHCLTINSSRWQTLVGLSIYMFFQISYWYKECMMTVAWNDWRLVISVASKFLFCHLALKLVIYLFSVNNSP